MGAAALLPILGGTAALGALSGFAGAAQANKAASASAASANNTAAYNKAQANLKLTSDQAKLAKQFSRYLGATASSAAERGVGTGGSTQAIRTSGYAAALQDQTDLELNTESQRTALDQQLGSDLIRISSTRRSVFLDTVGGGLQGLNAGIGLYLGGRAAFGPRG